MSTTFEVGASPLVLRGGRVLTDAGLVDAELRCERGVITELAASVDHAGAMVLDAGGAVVGPGLVDLHTHLREPGREQAETIETGARAAALGGYTAVVAMPNTEPCCDQASVALAVLERGRGACCEVAVAGAITVGRAGRDLAPLAELAALGVELFTDDGSGVQDGGVARRALEYLRGLSATYAEHCEDDAIAAGGVAHEGAWSSALGLPGQPWVTEAAMVARDLLLAELTGASLHLLHLSTARSVELVAAAKARGVAVTAEAAPHHFVLTDAALQSYDPCFRVNPPLRTEADVAAVLDGLCDGTIDAIATDHAPHTGEVKDRPFAEAPPGMLGLETAFSLAYEQLVVGRGVPIERLFSLLSSAPARIARLDEAGRRPFGHSAQGGPLRVGAMANLCVVDLEARWRCQGAQLASKAANTPYEGRMLQGRVRHTVLRGEPVVIDAAAQR